MSFPLLCFVTQNSLVVEWLLVLWDGVGSDKTRCTSPEPLRESSTKAACVKWPSLPGPGRL
jgi:hypothetical protein